MSVNIKLDKQNTAMERVQNPKQIIFFITDRCNARCPHCFYWKNMQDHKNELSLDEISKINFDGVTDLTLTGGEPTIREDLYALCAMLTKKVKNIAINSNGLLPEKLRPILTAFRNITLNVSLDGTEKVNDRIRGLGTFKRVIATLDMAKELGTHTIIVTTLSKANVEDLEELVALTKNKGYTFEHKFNITRGIDSSLFNLPEEVKNFHNPRDTNMFLDLPEMVSVYEKLKKLNKHRDFWTLHNQFVMEYTIKILKEKHKILPCYAGIEEGTIYPNGDVAACEFTLPFANLKDFDYDLNKLWNSQKANSLRQNIKGCFCTHPCNLSTTIAYRHRTRMRVDRLSRLLSRKTMY